MTTTSLLANLKAPLANSIIYLIVHFFPRIFRFILNFFPAFFQFRGSGAILSLNAMRPNPAIAMIRSLLRTPGSRARLPYRFYSSKTSDVVIIGGGPAGLTLAAALKNNAATKRLDVTLVEGSNLDRLKDWGPDSFENRVSSLSPKSVRFLHSIGAWPHLRQERIKDYDQMKVWDGVSGSKIEFDPFILGENTEIAWMVENSNLQAALYSRIQELNSANENESAVEILDKSRVSSITRDAKTKWPIVKLENGDELCSRLLVGADGANSPARTFAGIQARGWDYNTHGLVATLQLEWEDFRNIAWQRFLPSGPIALLPLPDGYASLVWSTSPEKAAHLKKLSPEDFCALVNAGFRLGMADLEYLHTIDSGIVEEVQWRMQHTKIEDEDNSVPIPVVNVLEGTRANFPLKMKHVDTYIGDRVALVGDAAHTTHPLAGQGLNMGQSDVANLVKSLETAMLRGLDIGTPLALESYWKQSYLSNHAKLGVVDKLHKLYSTDFYPVVQLRSWGLDLVNSSDAVKRFFMSQASN